MARRCGKKKGNVTPEIFDGEGSISAEKISEFVGKTFLRRDEGDEEFFYPVKILGVVVQDCSLLVEVKPVGGVGQEAVCLESLYTKNRAQQYIENRQKEEIVDQEYRKVRQGWYARERRAKFVVWVNENLGPNEVKELIEESGKKSLESCSDHFIERQLRRLIRAKHGLEPEDY